MLAPSAINLHMANYCDCEFLIQDSCIPSSDDVQDTESTARTLEAVRDGVLRDNLHASNLL